MEFFDYFCKRLRTMNMRRPEVVNQISEAIHKVAPTATAILYGSEARGDARSDSDIDVLIIAATTHAGVKSMLGLHFI